MVLRQMVSSSPRTHSNGPCRRGVNKQHPIIKTAFRRRCEAPTDTRCPLATWRRTFARVDTRGRAYAARSETRYIVLDPRTRRNPSDSHGKRGRTRGVSLGIGPHLRLSSRGRRKRTKGIRSRIRKIKRQDGRSARERRPARSKALRGFIWINHKCAINHAVINYITNCGIELAGCNLWPVFSR